MNKTLRLSSLRVPTHLRSFRLFLLTLSLCGLMQTRAETWTDGNGFAWSFTVNGTEATDIRPAMVETRYIYGDPANPEQGPVTLEPGDAAAGRFSSTEGKYFPTIPGDVYFGLKTLIFDIIDAQEGSHIWGDATDVGCTMRVMNGWWSAVYADDVPMSVGLWQLPITEQMARECAPSDDGGEGKDLDLLMTRGSITIKSVYYLSLPETVVVIPEKVYVGSTELTVTSIGAGAFSGCPGLTSVTIPASVTSIGAGAFFGCTGLTSVTINSDAIMSQDYSWDYSLVRIFGPQVKSVIIGEGVTRIGNFAFVYYPDLTSVTIPESVSSIGDRAFFGCTGLTSVTIPEGVTSIGDYAFSYCDGLTSVTINSDAIMSQDYSWDYSLVRIFGPQVKSVIIGEGVTRIGNFAFIYCSDLTSVTIPESVTYIGDRAFEGTSVTNVTIPEGVTGIGEGLFFGCPNLASVTIPSNVTSIGTSAFYGCTSLTSVTSLIEEPFEIYSNVFSGWDYDFTSATLYVPAGTKEKYLATPAWNQFQNIVEMGLEPVEQGETVDFGTDISEDTNIDGNTVGDIYYSISSGDGSYDPSEGCIVVTSPTDDETVSGVSGTDIFGEDFNAHFTGVVFKVAPGKGTIRVEAQTTGNMVLKVKIGDGEPITMELEGKLKVSFPYNVGEETYVYIYGSENSAAANGMRFAPSTGSLKIYGIEVESVTDGIETATLTGGDDDAPIYNLNGQRVNTPHRGVYIQNGKKVLVK